MHNAVFWAHWTAPKPRLARRIGRESVGSASGPAPPMLTGQGRRVGGLGPGLACESADARPGCPANRSAGRGPGFSGTHQRCRPDLPGLGKRPGFHRSGGQRVRAIPQPQKGMAVTIVETRAITGGAGHPRGRARRGCARPHRRAAGGRGVPGDRGRLRPPAELAGRIRDRVPGRDRRHRQLRRRPGPPRHRGRCPGRGGRPVRPAGSPPPGQVRLTRRRHRCPRRPVRAGPRRVQGRDGVVEAIRALMVPSAAPPANAPRRSTRPGPWS